MNKCCQLNVIATDLKSAVWRWGNTVSAMITHQTKFGCPRLDAKRPHDQWQQCTVPRQHPSTSNHNCVALAAWILGILLQINSNPSHICNYLNTIAPLPTLNPLSVLSDNASSSESISCICSFIYDDGFSITYDDCSNVPGGVMLHVSIS
jgi:hypothetical protein